jgi:peptidoglycan hydrolase-like protein with peptidoglycan-binding domain
VTDMETEAGTATSAAVPTAASTAASTVASSTGASSTEESASSLASADKGAQYSTHRRRVGRKSIVTVTVLALVAAAGGAVAAERGRIWPPRAASSGSGVQDNSAATTLATVTRQTLTAQDQVDGTLGYTGTYSVIGSAHGTITGLPAVGQVISQGQTVYQVDGSPVVLLYGSVPAYRNLSENDTGADVKQLNADLVALGYATSSQIDPASDTFGWETKAAVEALQAAMGVTQDGTLHLGQAVFLPSTIRITAVPATLGGQAGGPVAQATSTTRQVTVQLPATEQAQVKVGDQVVITLPDNSTTPGKVTSIGTVATTPSGSAGNSTPTITVDITPANPAATGTLDQAPVQVSIITQSTPNALVVPVTALLSLVGGGYAVEVAGADGVHRLVAVTVGLFDDAAGLVQVTGSGLHEGDRVVVAGT